MVRFAPIAAVSLMALPAFVQPAHAQGRIVRRDLGFSFVMPDGYEYATRDVSLSAPGMVLDGPLSRPTTQINTPSYALNTYLITGIVVTTHVPDPSKAESLERPRETEVKTMFEELRKLTNGAISINYQGAAIIKVDGVEATAMSLTIHEPIQATDLRLRVLFIAKDGKQFGFIFACQDSEFQEKVPAFEKLMASLRWLNRDGLPALPKPAPAKPAAPGKPKKK